MSEGQESKPKIIVDDDWKERVQAEKEAFKKQEEEGAPSGAESASAPADAEGEAGPIPSASFPLLLSSLATQALIALGQIPDPSSQKNLVRTDVAKHHIDMLGILEEKTAGNLTAEESQMLTGTLHDLRMMFVSASRNAPE